ncbi:conserved hypothetical protein [Leishmania mexicana MHOM/GT/2001/U1103]|uniref:Protein ZIP4 homolog n=1 Tax=Leishmania mexicana (strain MHOM/GT/2001/U1103) TaxID=929439 RepID=E9ARE2_LEIMU|nr:conserved hypothetical protein [Leishmania mexicana MHOM/GT/2001/U1103]CBZ25513.1 conserved hypothetical protein [Leishmania mexicana MHOM/GT/2001/U1103]
MTAATDGGASGVVNCAEWLHKRIPCWLDGDVSVHLEDALREVAIHLDGVSAFAEKGAHLPVKAALRVQVMALDSWNATSLCGWPLERKDLKVQARWLVTYLFLCSHCVFAGRELREAHLSHHLDDAEKCILMCLKTSKGLLRTRLTDAAEKLLTWAACVAKACAGVPGSSMRRFSAEVHFAQLRAAWEAAQHERACALATELADETRSSTTYTEALLEFIYNAGVKSLQEERRHAGALDAGGHAASEVEGVGLRACASGQVMPDVQASLQTLLLLSLRLQKAVKARSMKQRTFLGMTYLQYGYSLLLCGKYDAAVEAASTSYELLRTLEPIVIRFKAEVYRHATDEVVELFRALCSDATVAVGDLCAMASLALERTPGVQETLFAELHRRVAASASAVDQFRLLCVLIRHSSEWSVAELLRRLSNGDTPPPAFHRFLFCCLWRLSAMAVDAQPRCLSAATRWSCLETAQRLFRGVASEEERQAILLEMTQLALAMHDDGVDATEELEQTLALCQNVETIVSALEASSLQAQSQIAFLLGKNEHGMERVRALLACTAGETAVQACSELVTFLLRSSLLYSAGAVAELCVVAFHQHQSPVCIIEFAKVFAMGCLVDQMEGLRAEVGGILEVHVCPILQHVSLTLPDARWWSRFLWYAAEALLDSDPVRAVRLLQAGVELQAARSDAGEAEVSTIAADEFLRNRLCLLLDTEFDTFTAGQAALSTVELRRHGDCLASLLSSCDEKKSTTDESSTPRQRVTLSLALLEATLRDMMAHDDSTLIDVEALRLDELPSMAAISSGDLEQVAAVCHYAASRLSPPDSHFLCDAALNIMLAAAQLQLTGDITSTAALGALFATIYAAFKMARNADGRLLVSEALTAALPLLTGKNASLRSAFSHLHNNDGECSTVERDRGLCETVVEFFAVEAWNESVQWNILQRRALVERWRAVVAVLTSVLSDANASKAAITDLAAQMPLL